MTIHELKTDPEVFTLVACGIKTFEIRKDDRGFEYDDILHLRQTRFTGAEMAGVDGQPIEYTGRQCFVKVANVMRGPVYGLKEGWVIMSLSSAFVGN